MAAVLSLLARKRRNYMTPGYIAKRTEREFGRDAHEPKLNPRFASPFCEEGPRVESNESMASTISQLKRNYNAFAFSDDEESDEYEYWSPHNTMQKLQCRNSI